MFYNLVSTRDTKIDAAFTDEGRNVSSREKNKCYVMVLDQGDVETGFSPELDIAAGEEVEGRLLESALCQGCINQPLRVREG